MGSKPPKAPDPVDPGESALKYIEGMSDPELQEKVLSAERTYRPQYQELNLQDMLGYLQGTETAPGILDMQDIAAGRTEELRAKLASEQRAADIADVEALGGRATEALRASDPLMQALIGNQTQLTDSLYQRAQGLTPQQKRQADQQAREAFASRGRLDDNAAVAAEILNREDYMRANRMEAQQSAGQTYNMLKASSADPFQAILGRPAMALNTGVNTAGQADDSVGSSTPQLFDYDAGINLALQNNANQANYNANVYGAQQSMWGNIIGGGMQGLGAWAGSDRRLKKNITRIGTHPLGIGIYKYQMRHNDERQIGVMAQELQPVMPEAVMEHEDGYLMVDYSKL